MWKIKKYLIFYCTLVYKAAVSLDRPEISRTPMAIRQGMNI
jgi:hypothetical protein